MADEETLIKEADIDAADDVVEEPKAGLNRNKKSE